MRSCAAPFRLRQEAVLRTLTEDVLKSSEIEGEKLDAEQVRSSIAVSVWTLVALKLWTGRWRELLK
jgi:Fic family protein